MVNNKYCLIFIENSDSSKIQQFPMSSYDLYMGKYLEEAVYAFIDSNYHDNKTTVNNKKINYLAFFGKTDEMQTFLMKECKLINH